VKVEVIRETPVTPPVKEVVLRLSPEDAMLLKLITMFQKSVPQGIATSLVASPEERSKAREGGPVQRLLTRLGDALGSVGVTQEEIRVR
jgi:hypothetical protein